MLPYILGVEFVQHFVAATVKKPEGDFMNAGFTNGLEMLADAFAHFSDCVLGTRKQVHRQVFAPQIWIDREHTTHEIMPQPGRAFESASRVGDIPIDLLFVPAQPVAIGPVGLKLTVELAEGQVGNQFAPVALAANQAYQADEQPGGWELRA